MTSDSDDLEALFDQVASQRAGTVTANSSLPSEATLTQVETPEIADDAAGYDADDQIVSFSMSNGSSEQSSDAADSPEKPMYERVGNIARTLHDSLRELGYDRSLSNVANQITDAQDRLEYIATLTEQAATRVLNDIDLGLPQQEDLGKQAKQMEDRWAKLFEGKLSIDEFKALAGDSKTFAALVSQASETEKARLLDIMMAQDFQDITGQLIKKIVVITHTVETELAQLLKDNAPPEIKAAIAASEAANIAPLMQGPSTPGQAMAQNDVDSLLAGLGF